MELNAFRKLLIMTTRSFRAQYSESVVGLLWIFFPPNTLFCIYWYWVSSAISFSITELISQDISAGLHSQMWILAYISFTHTTESKNSKSFLKQKLCWKSHSFCIKHINIFQGSIFTLQYNKSNFFITCTGSLSFEVTLSFCLEISGYLLPLFSEPDLTDRLLTRFSVSAVLIFEFPYLS